MPKTNWQDPGSTEIISPHISGLQEAVGKIEDAIGLQTVAETNVPLMEVYISDTDRYRIYQAPVGKRNWVASPAPVIKKNGVQITTGFMIDYGGGAIVLSPAALATDTFTADVTRVNSTHSITPASIGAETPAGAQAKADAVQANLNSHLADYVRQPGFGVTAGGTTAYTLTLNPAPTSYTDGMGIAIKMNAANTGSSTINVNGLGAKPLKDPNGIDFASGTLKLNTIYSFKYDSVSGNFILQGKGGGGGNATAAQLLSGKTATVDSGTITGTMPDKTAAGIIITPSTADQAIPQGYYPGGLGDGKVPGDASLVAANILAGISIFGVVGTAKRKATGTVTSSSSTLTFYNHANSPTAMFYVIVSGLVFTPSKIHMVETSSTSKSAIMATADVYAYYVDVNTYANIYGPSLGLWRLDGSNGYISGGAFRIPVSSSITQYTWTAWE